MRVPIVDPGQFFLSQATLLDLGPEACFGLATFWVWGLGKIWAWGPLATFWVVDPKPHLGFWSLMGPGPCEPRSLLGLGPLGPGPLMCMYSEGTHMYPKGPCLYLENQVG